MILPETETDRAAAVIDVLEAGDGDDRFGAEFMADLFRRAKAADVRHPDKAPFLPLTPPDTAVPNPS